MYLYIKTINDFTITKRTKFSKEKYKDNNEIEISKEEFCKYTDINPKYINNILVNKFSAYELKNEKYMGVLKANIIDIDEDIKQSIKLIKEINLLKNDDLELGFGNFKDYINLEKIILPNLIDISDSCFKNCKKLYNIILPNTLKIICKEAFEKCESLHFITLPEGLNKIERYAFYKCINLSSIVIPQSVTKISSFAFAKCISLTNVKCPNNLHCLNDNYINDSVFRECYELKEINLPEGMTIIKQNTFTNCFSLEKINLPNSIIKIEQEAFYNCQKLNQIKFGKNLKEIHNYAFFNCRKIEKIEFPNKLEKLGNHVFASCTKLKDINFPDSLKEFGEHVFDYTLWKENYKNNLIIINNILIA